VLPVNLISRALQCSRSLREGEDEPSLLPESFYFGACVGFPSRILCCGQCGDLEDTMPTWDPMSEPRSGKLSKRIQRGSLRFMSIQTRRCFLRFCDSVFSSKRMGLSVSRPRPARRCDRMTGHKDPSWVSFWHTLHKRNDDQQVRQLT
jgi:hypothetical protein